MTRRWTTAEDAALAKLRQQGATSAQIGALLGRTKVAVNARAHLLRRGLRVWAWTAAEDQLLRDVASYRSCADVARELGRTAAAVSGRAAALGLHWVLPDGGPRHRGFTATTVAHLLGVRCVKGVTDWIGKGYLVATRRAPRLPERAGARPVRVAWRIMPDALRAFLRDYPWLYDRGRIVDRGWAAYVATLPRETYVGTREAARLLYLTPEGVTLAIRKGQLPAEKLGANWRIPLTAIRAYVPPPIGGKPLPPDLAAQRARTLARRKSRTYRLRPETVAAAAASRAARRAGVAA